LDDGIIFLEPGETSSTPVMDRDWHPLPPPVSTLKSTEMHDVGRHSQLLASPQPSPPPPSPPPPPPPPQQQEEERRPQQEEEEEQQEQQQQEQQQQQADDPPQHPDGASSSKGARWQHGRSARVGLAGNTDHVTSLLAHPAGEELGRNSLDRRAQRPTSPFVTLVSHMYQPQSVDGGSPQLPPPQYLQPVQRRRRQKQAAGTASPPQPPSVNAGHSHYSYASAQSQPLQAPHLPPGNAPDSGSPPPRKGATGEPATSPELVSVSQTGSNVELSIGGRRFSFSGDVGGISLHPDGAGGFRIGFSRDSPAVAPVTVSSIMGE